jgi:hypothetical protein
MENIDKIGRTLEVQQGLRLPLGNNQNPLSELNPLIIRGSSSEFTADTDKEKIESVKPMKEVFLLVGPIAAGKSHIVN